MTNMYNVLKLACNGVCTLDGTAQVLQGVSEAFKAGHISEEQAKELGIRLCAHGINICKPDHTLLG